MLILSGLATLAAYSGGVPEPSADIIWGVLLAALVGILGWGVSQARNSWETSRRLEDHIVECDKRQKWIMDKLNSMDAKLDRHGSARGTHGYWPWKG